MFLEWGPTIKAGNRTAMTCRPDVLRDVTEKNQARQSRVNKRNALRRVLKKAKGREVSFDTRRRGAGKPVPPYLAHWFERGRDVGDIAVRAFMRVSKVMEWKRQWEAERATRKGEQG